MRRLILFPILFILTACVPASAPSNTLTVFAASSLTNAFTEISAAFERSNPGVKVVFNFAGSQELRAQIEQGARADVFASADVKNIDDLKTLARGDARVFARNRLVVIAPKNNPAGIKTLQDLAKPGMKLVLADASVPVGNYSVQVLDKLSADAAFGVEFKTRVLARVVSRENNARQVVGKVSLGEADAGIVYATDAQSAADKLTIVEIPDAFNVAAIYPLVILKDSANAALAEKFSAFVLSSEGQTILKNYGFTAP